MYMLIADDNPVTRQFLKRSLTKWGHKVITADNGAQAWEILNGDRAPRMAILDWEMPVIDGISLCRKLRDRPTGPYIYVILLTSRSQPDDIAMGLAMGADDFLTKPANPVELRSRVVVGQRIIRYEATRLAENNTENHHQSPETDLIQAKDQALRKALDALEKQQRQQTELQKKVKALEQQLARRPAVVCCAREADWQTLHSASGSIEQMFNLNIQQLVNDQRLFTTVIEKQDQRRIVQEVQRMMHMSVSHIIFQYHLINANQQCRLIQDNCRIIRNAGGSSQITGFLSLLVDITEQVDSHRF